MCEDIDWPRFPFEARRAIEDSGVLLEQLTPGVQVDMPITPDGVTVMSFEGRPLATIPLHRLRRVNEERLSAVLVAWGPVDVADQLVAAFKDGAWSAPPDSEYVEVRVGPGRLARVHRSLVVDQWPAGEE